MLESSAINYDQDAGEVKMLVDTDVHAREAIFGAAYVFIDRCYVWLDKADDGRLVIQLRRRGDDESPLEQLAGDFGNELLAQSARAISLEANGDLVQAIVNRALVGAGAGHGEGQAEGIDLSELEELELDDEPFDDPLGIAMSWEEKYGKKSPAGESGS